MKKAFFIIACMLLMFVNQSWGQKLNADFYYATFCSSKTGPYIETYLSFNGDSLNYVKTEDSTLVASVEITMLFKNADEVKEYRTYKIATAPLSDTATVFPDLLDQQRILISNGVYNFDLIINDLNARDSIKSYYKSDIVSVDFPEGQIAMSDIEMVQSYQTSIKQNIFKKGDFECIPLVSNVYNDEDSYIKIYNELYNAAKELGPLETFYYMFHIQQVSTNKSIKGFSYFDRQKAYNFNTVYKELNMSKLPSGDYYAVVEIQDSLNNVVLSKKKYFKREGTIKPANYTKHKRIDLTNTFVEKLNVDSLSHYINSFKPISDFSEVFFIDSILHNADNMLKKRFIYEFWKSRTSKTPGKAFAEYITSIQLVENQYATNLQKGYETAKGKIAIKYGFANEIITGAQENGYNIEKWQYYRIADKTNVEFVFEQQIGSEIYRLKSSSLEWESVMFNDPTNAVDSE